MSEAKLARALNLNPGTLSSYLNFRSEPRGEGFYIAAAAVLGCKPDELKPVEEAAA